MYEDMDEEDVLSPKAIQVAQKEDGIPTDGVRTSKVPNETPFHLAENGNDEDKSPDEDQNA